MKSLNKSYQRIFLSLISIFLSFTLLGATAEPVAVRQHNIELMQQVLKQGQYTGYDLIVMTLTTEQEAQYQEEMFEEIFAGTTTSDGRAPLILAVADWSEGGQLIGAINTWLLAEKRMRQKHPDLMAGYRDLIEYIQANHYKVAVFHDGGKGERCSPLTQSLGNSRGAQQLVGSLLNAKGEEVELNVLRGVVLQCSSFAATNPGTHLDTFWTSQIAFGSYPHDHLVRSNFHLDKFLVGFDQKNLIPQNIADFGTAALNREGRLMAFYGNKRFAARKGDQYVVDATKIQRELFSKGEQFAYDFGSFSVSFEMWQLLIDYWKKKNIFESEMARDRHAQIKRDIDPHFIQPLIRLLYAMNDLADRTVIDQKLPLPSSVTETSRDRFNAILQEMAPAAYHYIWEDVNQESDPNKKKEATLCMHEMIEFYLLYRQTPVLADLTKIFGFIDLGEETQWFRYRRPIDIMNEKFEMLTDLIGKKIEVQLNGSVQESEADEAGIQRSKEARLMRGLTEEKLVQFTVEGKAVTLTFAEAQAGKHVNGVYVKNSIVQHCDLRAGSSIVNSVVNNVAGKVNALYSYLESSTAPSIQADSRVVHQVIDDQPIKADREVISDIYKTALQPAYHGRMRAPIGYDPKGMAIYQKNGKLDETIRYFIERIPYDLKNGKEFSDKTARTEDGRFTFEEIREIEPLSVADRNFRELIRKRMK